jgi:CBS domain-containing protein
MERAVDLSIVFPGVLDPTLVRSKEYRLARDIMSQEVVTITPEVMMDEAAGIMGEKRIGSVIITRQGEPRSIFTERDLVTTFLAKDRPLNIKVGEVVSSPLLVDPSWISVHHAAFMMATKHIRRLPITEYNKIVGIITAGDLVEAYAK